MMCCCCAVEMHARNSKPKKSDRQEKRDISSFFPFFSISVYLCVFSEIPCWLKCIFQMATLLTCADWLVNLIIFSLIYSYVSSVCVCV